MKMPEPFWGTVYSRSRRNHAHRCACCNKIISEGSAVFMCRKHKGSIAIHQDCANIKYGKEGHFNYRDFMEARGMEYLAACGWKAAKDWLNTAPINQTNRSN